MDGLRYEGDSKRMFDAIMKEIPPLFRGGVKKNISRWIAENNIEVVTEDVVIRAVKEIAPKNIADRIIKELGTKQAPNG